MSDGGDDDDDGINMNHYRVVESIQDLCRWKNDDDDDDEVHAVVDDEEGTTTTKTTTGSGGFESSSSVVVSDMIERLLESELLDGCVGTDNDDDDILLRPGRIRKELHRILKVYKSHSRKEQIRYETTIQQITAQRDDVRQQLNDSQDAVIESDVVRTQLECTVDTLTSKNEQLQQQLDAALDEAQKLEMEVTDIEEQLLRAAAEEEEQQQLQNKQDNDDDGDECDDDTGAKVPSSRRLIVELREAHRTITRQELELSSKQSKIDSLEQDLEDARTVPQLQIDELDEQLITVQAKLKSERLSFESKLTSRDVQIQDLMTKLECYSGLAVVEQHDPSSSSSFSSGHMSTTTTTTNPPSHFTQDLISVRTKLNEARADATAVREELAVALTSIEDLKIERNDLVERNDMLVDKSSKLEQTVKELTTKTDELHVKLLEWTERTYDWKERAESAERKLTSLLEQQKKQQQQQQHYHDEYGTDTTGTMSSSSSATDDIAVESEQPSPVTTIQGLYLQSVMDQRKTSSGSGSGGGGGGGGGGWNLFRKVGGSSSGGTGGGDPSGNNTMDQTRIKTLEDQRTELLEQVAELQSEVVKLQSHHKNEIYTSQKTIERLESDVEALTEQLKLNQELLVNYQQQQHQQEQQQQQQQELQVPGK